MVFGVHREPLLAGRQARASGHGPAFEDSVEFESQIPVQPPRLVPLDREGEADGFRGEARAGVSGGFAGSCAARFVARRMGAGSGVRAKSRLWAYSPSGALRAFVAAVFVFSAFADFAFEVLERVPVMLNQLPSL
jgi:hypothetical protein